MQAVGIIGGAVLVFSLASFGLSVAAEGQSHSDLDAAVWSDEYAGTPLDLRGFELAFSDEFDEFSISADLGAENWKAPVHTDVGASTWDPPGSEGPYFVNNGVLTIRATLEEDGIWHSGSIQTVDSEGNGYAQQYGYFEARLKFPRAVGAWTAFWLKSQAEHWDLTMTRTEIDVVEWYGGDPTGHHGTVHLWPARNPKPDELTEHWWTGHISRYDNMEEQWRLYGVLITPAFVITYLDRVEIARFPTLRNFRTPLYPLISLTLYEKDALKAISPIELDVDYIRIYESDNYR